MPKRKRHEPYQRNLSVSDVPNYSTPEGSSMANEEMRRLRLFAQQLQDQLDALSGGGDGGQAGVVGGRGGGPAPAIPTLTVWNRPNADGTDVAVNNVVIMDFDDQGQTSKQIPVNFGIVELAPGRAVIQAWVPDMNGVSSLQWYLRVDSEPIGRKVVNDGVINLIPQGTITITRNGSDVYITGTGLPGLTVMEDAIAIGGDDTTELNFESQGQTTTDIAVHFVVDDDGAGRRSVRAYVPASAGTFTFNVSANADGGSAVASGATVDFSPDNGTVVITRTGDDFTFKSPLQIQDDGINEGGDDTITIDFDSQGETYTDIAVNFAVIDDGGGVRRIQGFVSAAAVGYTFNVSANADGGVAVVSGATVDFSPDNGTVVITRTGDDFTFKSPLTILDDTSAVGGDDTIELNFDSNSQTSTDVAVNFVVTDDGSGRRTVQAYVPAGSYTWTISANGDGGATVVSGATVDFSATNGTIVVTRTGDDLEFKSPLTILDDGLNVGGDDTVELDFDSNGQTSTAIAVNFVVTDEGSGRRSVQAYVPAGAYTWTISANADGGSVVASGATVDFSPDNGTIVITRTGDDLTFKSPLQIQDDAINEGGDDTTIINFDSQGSTSTDVAVNFEVIDDGGGSRTIRAWVPTGSFTFTVSANGDGGATVVSGATVDYSPLNGTVVITRSGDDFTFSSPLQIQDDGVDIGGEDTITVNFDSNSQTATDVAVNFEVYDDGSGVRRVRAWVPTGSYSFYVAVEGVGGSEEITNGETLTFRTIGNISADRVGNIITHRVPESDTGTSEGKRVLVGFITWDNAVAAPAAGKYGTKVYYDIVHNWDLLNMHMWELHLTDVTIQEDSTDPGYGVDKVYYRSGPTTLAGENPGDQYVRLKPYWQAMDKDTVRVWITHSRIYPYPTDMKMWYVLREA